MPKILIIDDDDQFRNFLVEALSDNDFDVVSAANGVEGVDRVNTEKPDLVITDIVMPEKEGVEVILDLQKNNAELPIIATSGGNMGNANSYLGMAKKLGAKAILPKPFRLEELLVEIDNLLNAN